MTVAIPYLPEILARDRPLERLEAQLVALASHPAAVTRRWLALPAPPVHRRETSRFRGSG